MISDEICWQAFQMSSWLRAWALGLPESFANFSKEFSESGQFSDTHSLTSLKAMLYSLLKFDTLLVMKPLWVILLNWEVLSDRFLRSNYLEATVRSKLVVDRFRFEESKWKPKLVLRKFFALSSIYKNSYGASASLWVIYWRCANFLRLSVVNFIYPFFIRSSTLLLRIFLVSRWRYSLNLTATRLFLEMRLPTLGISILTLDPESSFSEMYLMTLLIAISVASLDILA